MIIKIVEEEVKLLSREEYARRGAELKKARAMEERAANEKIAMVYSPITSPGDLIPIISEEKESCFRIALGYAGGDRDAAEDINQQAFVNAYLNLKSGGPYLVPRKEVKRIQLDDDQAVGPKAHEVIVKKPTAWLHTIVRNTGRNEVLRRRKAGEFLDKLRQDLERESHHFEQPEMIALRNISNEELCYYVNCLPGQFSKIIKLHFFRGFEYEEIAEELKCPSSTVRVSAMRALAMLRDVLQGKRDVKGGRIGRPKTSGNRCSSGPMDKKTRNKKAG